MSLENVIVKESESLLIGTVKVKNLSFHKEVFVRSTWDNWKTQQDTICTFSPVSTIFVIFTVKIVYTKIVWSEICSRIKCNTKMFKWSSWFKVNCQPINYSVWCRVMDYLLPYPCTAGDKRYLDASSNETLESHCLLKERIQFETMTTLKRPNNSYR